MTTEAKKALIETYVAAYNRGDIQGMLATLAEDIHFENIQDGAITASAQGIDEFRALAERTTSLFEHREQVIEGLSEAVNTTTATIRFYGKLAIDLPNGMEEGEEIHLQGTSEFEFDNDKIRRIRDFS